MLVLSLFPGIGRGHVWLRDEDGDIEYFGYSTGKHNGPVCVNCGYGFCHHCHDLPDIDCSSAAHSTSEEKT